MMYYYRSQMPVSHAGVSFAAWTLSSVDLVACWSLTLVVWPLSSVVLAVRRSVAIQLNGKHAWPCMKDQTCIVYSVT